MFSRDSSERRASSSTPRSAPMKTSGSHRDANPHHRGAVRPRSCPALSEEEEGGGWRVEEEEEGEEEQKEEVVEEEGE